MIGFAVGIGVGILISADVGMICYCIRMEKEHPEIVNSLRMEPEGQAVGPCSLFSFGREVR